MFNVVLVEPQIPPNTGSIGRLCLATQCTLHLVEPLGFEITTAKLRRAGLDYWEHLSVKTHASWDAFVEFAGPGAPMAFFSKKVEKTYVDVPYQKGMFFIFGKETLGLSDELLAREGNRSYRIPILDDRVRSLNLANAASIIVYEGLKQIGAWASPASR